MHDRNSVSPRRSHLPARLLAGIAFACTLFASPASRAAYLHEPISGEQFDLDRNEDGIRFRCIGTGAHKIFTFKVYAIAYCLEESTAYAMLGEYAQTRFPGLHGKELVDRLSEDQRFFDLLSSAPGDKMIVVRFLRDIPGERLSGSFRDSLSRQMPRSDAERVAAMIGASNVHRGQTALLFSRGDDLVMRLGDQSRVVENAPLVTQRLWRVWLCGDSPTPNLKRSIAIQAVNSR
jgi:hypothetical protein